MIVAFWALCALIVYAYAGYPLVIALLAALAGRRYDRDDSFAPAVSLLVPAYNEERIIAAKLDNALALDYPKDRLEIIVASESDDATNEIVRGYAPRGVRLVASHERKGKVANLHRAIPHATAGILVFTDANAMFRPDALRKLVRHFADARVGSVSGRLVYTNPGGAASASAEGTYWDLEMMIKRASSALGALPGANGSLFALRRELYSPIAERRGDDFELPIRVILQGRASILEPDAISEEPAAGRFVEEYRRKVRIINWMFLSALILLGEALSRGRLLLAFQLLSHKLNRWMVPFWLLALLPVSLAAAPSGALYRGAAAAQVLVYLLAAAGALWGRTGRKAPRLLGLPLYFIVVNAASFVGIVSWAAGREVRWHKRADALSSDGDDRSEPPRE